jgi:transcription initiation factor TFIID TATA-box-binding protein
MGKEKLNLDLITMQVPFMEFNSKRFAAGVIRLANPRTTCLVFASGKGVCTGAKTEHASRLAAMKYVMLLKRCGIAVELHNFKIQNMVAAVHCNLNLDIQRMADEMSGFVSYEPDLFPGLMYRVKIPNPNSDKHNTIVFLCFHSGKCVITGGRNREQIMVAWREFYTTSLRKYLCFSNTKANATSPGDKCSSTEEDQWHMQQIMCTTSSNKEDCENLQLANMLNPEAKMMSTIRHHIMNNTHDLDVPQEHCYAPTS